jgi:hypothetical protein
MENKSAHIVRLAGSIIGITILISVIVIAIGTFSHWNTPVQYSNGFFTAGAIVIVIGVLSIAGGFEQRADFSITYAESAGQASIAERTQRMMADINQRYGVMVLLAGAGALLIFISIAISRFL